MLDKASAALLLTSLATIAASLHVSSGGASSPPGVAGGGPPPGMASAPARTALTGFDLLLAPPAKLAPTKADVYEAGVVIRKSLTEAKPRKVTAEWIGVDGGRRPAQWLRESGAPVDFVTLRRADIVAAKLALGPKQPVGEAGYLRFLSCPAEPLVKRGQTDQTPAVDCVPHDSALALTGESVPTHASLFSTPALLALGAIFVAALVLLSKTGLGGLLTDVGGGEWRIGDSFAANLNIGTALLNSLASIKLSFDAVESGFTAVEFTSWVALYALSTALAPMVFGLLKRPAPEGKTTGSLIGFLAASVLNLFGVFGQLGMAYELLSILPQADLIAGPAAEGLKYLPVVLGAMVLVHVAVSFYSIRTFEGSTAGGAPHPGERRWGLSML